MIEFIFFALVFGVAAAVAAYAVHHRRRLTRAERHGENAPLVFLDARLGVAERVFKHEVPEGYRLACLLFGSGLIDRTGTLDHGFPVAALDPIPTPEPVGDMATLVRTRADALRGLAEAQDRPVRLLWSGGIDSTAAACALLNAFDDAPTLLEFRYTKESRDEYPLFYDRHLKRRRGARSVSTTRKAIEPGVILCTGEHGDQLFGSMTALGQPWDRVQGPWETGLRAMMTEAFGDDERTDIAFAYLAPQIARCPTPLQRLFDVLWWLNFSLKWQAVSLRMFVDGDAETWARRQDCEHFFRTDDFQRWSMTNPDKKIDGDWTTYKWPLKQIIRDFTDDTTYYETKEKVPSLRGRMGARPKAWRGLATAVTADGRFVHQRYSRALAAVSAAEIELAVSSEARLWRALEDEDGE